MLNKKMIQNKSLLFTIIISIALLFKFTFIQSHISSGWCPTLVHENNKFDIKPYEGVWYEQIRNSDFFIEKGECAIDDLKILNENEYQVLNTEISKDNGELITRHASMKLYSKEKPFNYGIKFFDMQPRADYQIFDTDYKNFAIVYSCTNLLFSKYELIWIMSREPEMDKNLLENLIQRIEKELYISRKVFYYTNQSNEVCKRK
jgi:apolipoprotein D and lipocalin family protein